MENHFQDDERGDENKSSLPWASFNFINSIIGSGVIGECVSFNLEEMNFVWACIY